MSYNDIQPTKLAEQEIKEVNIQLSNVCGIMWNEGQIYLQLNINNEIFMTNVPQDLFKQMFPSVIKVKSGKFALLGCDKQTLIQFDENNEDLVKTLGILPSQLNNFKKNNEDDHYAQLVKTSGFEKEYCLLFGGQIIFHSSSKKDMETYRDSHPYLEYTEYYPQLNNT